MITKLFFLTCSICFLVNSYAVENFDFFKGEKTNIKDPFQLRDPFKKPMISGTKKVISTIANKVGENSYSNIPSVSGIGVEDILVVGVMLGKNRRAMVRSKSKKETFILKEGMTLGVDQSVVKAILPGGIVLVEKIKNVYDQYEYLETLIPIITE